MNTKYTAALSKLNHIVKTMLPTYACVFRVPGTWAGVWYSKMQCTKCSPMQLLPKASWVLLHSSCQHVHRQGLIVTLVRHRAPHSSNLLIHQRECSCLALLYIGGWQSRHDYCRRSAVDTLNLDVCHWLWLSIAIGVHDGFTSEVWNYVIKCNRRQDQYRSSQAA